MGKKKKKRGVDVDLIQLINQGRVRINLARAARIVNTRHATRHPKAIFHLFKGPLKYLVTMIRGCHARAILLPVVRKFFARFLASRRRPVAGSSKSQIIFLFRCDKHKRNFFVYFLN